MEYLPRIFKCMSFLPTFRFHPMGQQLQLTHLIFADDLMIFYKGEINTVTRVKETLEHQCKTRLVANVDKSKYHPSWYGDQMKEQLISLIGFTQVYFLQDTWAALDFKEWSKMECQALQIRLLENQDYLCKAIILCRNTTGAPRIAFLHSQLFRGLCSSCLKELWKTLIRNVGCIFGGLQVYNRQKEVSINIF